MYFLFIFCTFSSFFCFWGKRWKAHILKIYNAAQSIIIHSAYSAPNSSYPLAYATPFLLNDMTFPLSLPLCHSWCSIIYCSAARLAGQGQGLLTACHAEAFPNSSRGSKALVPRPAFSQIHPFNFYNPWNSLLNFDWKKLWKGGIESSNLLCTALN